MLRHIETDEDIERALVRLAELDPSLRPVMEAAGPVPLRRQSGGLKGLCAIVTAQQVSKASADAIFARLNAVVDLDDHRALLALDEEHYRAAGVSRPKQKTLGKIAEAVEAGKLDFERVANANREDAISDLVHLHGIGVWTAECYLLFCIGHPDVFPAGDLALQVAVGEAYAMTERPATKPLAAFASRWAPYRSVAARLFWAYYGVLTKRDAVPVGA